ncbi:enoyl-CoA hydratase [Nocardia macrotermitis]|uniref:1,2-epoxyphenylacetyl-CoA isomerase n=1 Tax=Nocardia macrotermitis TaxID=2585198 RepID=A0A7K0D6Z1_9NOCA|nr:enoyl-CoA hydratase [Nocardia macrotermitis]MQY21525.1 1,2-epoxyphenylacetyl-CoA isomerase [Nocardia macrotermitis]
MTTPPHLLVERTDAVARLTFNRPDRLNALTAELLDETATAVADFSADPEIRVLVLTGAGRAFSSGADLSRSAVAGPQGVTIDAANRLIRALRAAPQPVIAAINGPAVGVGCSIALAADLTVARESAYLLLAFTRVGLMPDGGATALLPALIGPARAARMAMLAERIPAPQAADWGLLSHVVPDADLDTETATLTTQLAAGPTAAYTRIKRAFNKTALPHLEQALQLEREGQAELFETADVQEGIAAFAAKRPPQFLGH